MCLNYMLEHADSGKIMKNDWKNQKLFAFNIWDINSARAVIDAAVDMDRNVILQTSANIYEKILPRQLREFVTSYTEDLTINAILHLDHCGNEKIIIDAIHNGWDMVMIDASAKGIDENMLVTNRVAQYAHERGVLVEAEIGQVRGVEDNISVENDKIADRKEIAKFLKHTDIDYIAVAFGNAHGLYKGTPRLHYELIEYTGMVSSKPFVVHGGSGLDDNTLKELLSFENVKKINISTDVKLAYKQGIENAIKDNMFERQGFQAVMIEQYIHEEIGNLVKSKLRLLA